MRHPRSDLVPALIGLAGFVGVTTVGADFFGVPELFSAASLPVVEVVATSAQEVKLANPEVAEEWVDTATDDAFDVELVDYSSPTDFCLSVEAFGSEPSYYEVDRPVGSCSGGPAS